MAVSIQIPSRLREYCGPAPAEVVVLATTVGDALRQLANQYPHVYCGVCDETGAVRQHVHLFVNSHLVPGRQAFAAPLAPGDVLFILPAVSGG